MRSFSDLEFGFSDAENYRRRENKQFLEKKFVRTNALEQICEPSTSFIIGEKGTGKTAYAVYISNTMYRNNIASIRYIRETDFLKFIALKTSRHLDLSDYVSIWKVIIYLLLSQQIHGNESRLTKFARFPLFVQLQQAIDEYYSNAFSPEIVNALHFVERSQLAAELLSKYSAVGGKTTTETDFTESRFQINLLVIQRKFEAVFQSLKLSRNHILFIDGIDIRPQSVPYNDYLNCIKGLANAVWHVNNDIFGTIKDSKGRLRVVLLVRPDIFQTLGLQNPNTKIRDNSVLLDWRTTYAKHRNSELFEVVDNLLKPTGTSNSPIGASWDHYFPFDSPNVIEKFSVPNSFVGFLRLSLYRPRDFITMLGILQQNLKMSGNPPRETCEFADVNSTEFRNKVAEYLLGEIKDQLMFYYSNSDYEIFLKFFEFLYGRAKFSYDEYEDAFEKVINYIGASDVVRPRFMANSAKFLQFLYDLNVICYIEEVENGKSFIRWCFRERNYANIAPKIRLGEMYEIHYGLGRALNLGMRIQRRTKTPRIGLRQRSRDRGRTNT